MNAQIKGLGDRIRELRIGQGFTQLDLAQRLNAARSIVSSYENGTRFPSYEKLIKLAEIFDVSTDYLLGLELDSSVDLSCLNEEKKKTVISLVETMKK